MMHVRDQDIAVEGEFTSDGMRLELSIDLDDLLRDGGVLWICKRDAYGTFARQALLVKGTSANERMTSHFVPIIVVSRRHG